MQGDIRQPKIDKSELPTKSKPSSDFNPPIPDAVIQEADLELPKKQRKILIAPHKHVIRFWSWSLSLSKKERFIFAGGALLATMAQGIALGAILQGIHVEGRHYAGGWWDWLTPFSILTGVALVIGYALLGATWLVMKTEGELRDRAYHLSWFLLLAMLGAIGAVSIATPFLHVQYTQRWFAWPNIVLTAPVPVAVAAVTVLLLRSLANKYDYQPFFLTLALFALSYAGLGISMYPYIVPQSITIWQAASPENSQVFMLFGVAVLIPLILGYTAWAYWVFRGKVKPESGYH